MSGIYSLSGGFGRKISHRSANPCTAAPKLWQTCLLHAAMALCIPPWCNGSTTAFGAVRTRFESWRRSAHHRGGAYQKSKESFVTDSNLAIVILAAGQGTRMKSETPKLLHTLAGIPIVSHVLATARELDAAYTVAVVRHERDALVAVITDELPNGLVVDQDETPGTGRAVEQAIAALPADFTGDVLVINGDTPMLDVQTLAGLVNEHRRGGASATLLSAFLDDPSGYGRIIRTPDQPET